MWLWVWLIPLVVVVAALIHVAVASRPYPRGRVLEIFVIHALFWGVGVMGLMTAYMMGTDPTADQVAKQLGWRAGNAFQGMAAGRILGLGIGGIGVVWFRGGWIVALTVAAPLFGWAEVVLWAVKGVPAGPLGAALVYNVTGGLVLIGLAIAYRWRAGHTQFWAPTSASRDS